MAEDGIGLPAASEKNKPNGGVDTRRKSTGTSTPLNGGKSVVPNYMRASTGSRHDLCKFGGSHAHEEKTRRPFSGKIAAKSVDNHISVEIFVPAEKNKTSEAKIKHSHAKPRAIDISKCEVSPIAIVKPDFTLNSNGGANPIKTKTLVEKMTKTKMAMVKHNHSPNSNSCLPEAPKSVKQAMSSSSEKVETFVKQASPISKEEKLDRKSSEKVSFFGKQAAPKSKEENLHRRSSEKVGVFVKQAAPKSKEENLHRKSSERVGVLVKQASPKLKEEKLHLKSVTSTKLKPLEGGTTSLKPKLKEKPVSSPGCFSQQKDDTVKMEKQKRTPKGSAKAIPTSQRPRPSLVRVASLNSRKSKGSKIVSSIKNDKKTKKVKPDQPKTELKQSDNEVQEKTLYVIEMKTEKKPLESAEKEKSQAVESYTPPLSKSLMLPGEKESTCLSEDQDESEDTVTESETDSFSEYEEQEEEEEDSTLKQGDKGGPRKVNCEKNRSQPQKLLFRRGKVVDIQQEDNSPRRLKFRQQKIIRENHKMKGESRRSFKKGGAVADYDSTVKNPGYIQGLFNNVIEETASKLVETRKSKVKALVGAFETVISLQEKRHPSVNT
ncbi:hypothetical protein ACFE04_004701 [Oxalis oulophora]